MSKYNQLVNEYADNIAEVKRLRSQWAELRDRYNQEAKENSDYGPSQQTVLALDAAYHNWVIATDRLQQDIEAEYHKVPFSAPRQQGIDRFWELAGLKEDFR